MTDQNRPRDTDSPLRQAATALQQMQSRLDAVDRASCEPIAIVGMACRFPGGAEDPDSYWRLLRDGADLVGEVPPTRWETAALYDPDPDAVGRMYCRHGGFLRDIEHFDASFFGISAREAASMDPQQRLALEVTWEALEDAAVAPKSLAGTSTGVFLGICAYGYGLHTIFSGVPERIDPYCGTGIALNVAAGRISYTLGLQGPNMPVDTACSSSLVAPHLAIQSLRTGQCDLALAGGVNVLIAPELTVYFCKLRALSTEGRCKTFDASADGYVRGEGCGMIVLKRLSDALADGDRIVALLRGSAVNHDGRSGGLTVPNGRSQQAVIRKALANARLSPSDIDYIEAHGTGTPLGDPIEVHALAELFGHERRREAPLLLGSVKTNIGHLEAAAGVAGIIKVALALQREELPPHLHFTNWNPHINLDGAGMRITTARTPWRKGDRRRVAGVSSFGISGTNAHLIMEEAPAAARRPSEESRHLHLLTVSAKSSGALDGLVARYARQLSLADAPRPEDAAFTANTGRAHFNHRIAVIAATSADMQSALAGQPAGQAQGRKVSGVVEIGVKPTIAFLFSGQGSQYPGMARRLSETQPSFRAALQRCDELLAPELGRPLLPLLFGQDPDAQTLLDQTRFTQPALFAVEYALTELWRSWGVAPDAVLGHSVGEFAAACAAGVFSLEDGLRLIARRGRLMSAQPAGGVMAAVRATLMQVEDALVASGSRASIAAINGPEQIVISGSEREVERALQQLRAAGVAAQRLKVSHAFHSELMDPVLDELELAASEVKYSSPRIRLASNLTGAFARPDDIGPHYWRSHTRQPVRFVDGMRALAEFGCNVFLEIGPSPTLSTLGRSCLPDSKLTWLASLRRGKDDLQQVLEVLAEMYVRGVDVDWTGYHLDARGRKIPLPTGPFKRDRFWIPRLYTLASGRPGPASPASAPGHRLLGSRLGLAGRETIHQTTLNRERPTFLSHHQVHGVVVFPATGYCEMALAASAEDGRLRRVSTLAVEEPLVLSGNAQVTVQTVIRPVADRGLAFEVFSLREESSAEQPSWKRHAVATLEATDDAPVDVCDLAQLRRDCHEALAVESLYARMHEHGMDYGPAFRGIQELYRGDGHVLARLELPDAVSRDSRTYHLHPALLDAALQAMGATLVVEAGVSYLPVGLDALELSAPVPAALWCHGSTRRPSGSSGDALADFRLIDDGGCVIARVTGVRFRRATRAAILESIQDPGAGWLHEVQWRRVDSAEAPAGVESGCWLIFSDRRGIAAKVQARLNESGATAILVTRRDTSTLSGRTDAGLRVDPTSREDVTRLLDGLPAPGLASLRGVVCFPDEELLADGEDNPARACTTVLHLVQALAERHAATRLWLVTHGAQAVQPEGETVSAGQAALWGLGRVVGNEHPELRCTLVDLESSATGDEDERLVRLLAGEGEDQIAVRGESTYVARLVRRNSPDRGGLARPEGQPFQLRAVGTGLLDGLHLAAVDLREPADGEVRIRVHATGLNFRDVLNVLGMYPGDAGPLGGECAGDVISADPRTGFQPGQRVVAIAAGSFATEVVVPAELVVAMPGTLSDEEAATLPVAFLTADYALNRLGQMSRGEKILIHAASGGVGSAAIQLAMRAGVEVFATAGSEEKRTWLRSLGVQHVMDSRSLAFKEEIPRLTDGRGVDLVLNSLAGEAIPAGLSVLAPGGRFLEIGKADVWSQERIQSEYPHISYHPVALDTLSAEEPSAVQRMLRRLVVEIAAGRLQPLPYRAYPIEESQQAFRFMQQAKHIGKIVITQQTGAGVLHPDATYLITGGTGALGLQIAQHFAEAGARALALVARSDPSAHAHSVIVDLRDQGVNVAVLRADVSRRGELSAVMEEIRRSMPPLRGVVHAAGVLSDGMLVNQTAAQFETVLAPKAAGAWNLHALTQEAALDFFVLFSSAAAVLGSPGQANYAAANAYLDGLAHYRRSQGLAAASINWGAWEGLGMASGSGTAPRDWSALGMRLIEPREGLALLDQVIAGGATQIVALPIQWDRFLSQFPGGTSPPLLWELNRPASRRTSPGAGRAQLLARLENVPEDERARIVQEEIEKHAVAILGLDPSSRIDPAQPLHDVGFDSLMAVELRNALSAYVRDELPVTLAFDYPTLESLADYLADVLMETETGEAAAHAQPPEGTSAMAAGPAPV